MLSRIYVINKFSRLSPEDVPLVTDSNKLTENENQEYYQTIISNPIHIYKLIKEMLWFSEDIYMPLLSSSQEGKCGI